MMTVLTVSPFLLISLFTPPVFPENYWLFFALNYRLRK
ncbi:putative membrane protein [Microcystis aeruginosa TAIHU98]|uniref:Putative membrane protein n=1 Tax=Microcystis aeruginosa TAIHU98 TaxID=1134457 RepID=L7E838_MICAE|nr:putative membrane protein [Microcystis aeruginosa TAIHU98]